ncbi:hypothetical protein CJ030_MR5G010045 [Morella rubra]|uniref:Uncharacterized protein n=1 Tax=Morella rubra TaxID=262757 RepID=A0A6A1VIS7_9ROSI|nr:hypothetical protein CJ030_MR5G010045 [Morella rubra]
MEETQSANSIEIVDHVPTDPKAREKSPLACPRPQTMRTNPSGKIASTSNLSTKGVEAQAKYGPVSVKTTTCGPVPEKETTK